MPTLPRSGQRTHTGLGLAPKIAGAVVLIMGLGLAAVTGLSYMSVTEASRGEIGRQLEGRAVNAARVIDARVAAALQNLDALGRSEAVQSALRAGREKGSPAKARRSAVGSPLLPPPAPRVPGPSPLL